MSKEEKQNYTQSNVDMMLWQYAIGVLAMANQLVSSIMEMDRKHFIDAALTTLMDDLTKQRYATLANTFHVPPSFAIVFHLVDGKSYGLEKVKP